MPTLSISYEAALRGIEIAAITLAVFDTIAAGLVILFILLDSNRQRRVWLEIPWERRAPIYLAISVLVSHVVFMTRECLEIGALDPLAFGDASGDLSQNCIVINQLSWWGISAFSRNSSLAIWLPILACTVQGFSMAGSIIMKVRGL